MGNDDRQLAAAAALVVAQLVEWRDVDEPMVEAIGNSLVKWQRLDSQEQARRILDTVVEVLERELGSGASGEYS